jgi:hypothetical protein
MKIQTAIIHRISQRFGLPAIIMKTEQPLVFVPGQYLAASSKSENDSQIPLSLFIESSTENEISIGSPAPPNWNPGHEIVFRGPLGQGYSLPVMLKRLALIGFDDHPGRLMALVNIARNLNVDIVMAGDFISDPVIARDIPANVELTKLENLDDLFSWADFIAVDVPSYRIQELNEILQSTSVKSPRGDMQVLIYTSMPCAAIAECGICAIKTVKGYKLACQDGPVFNLNDINFN